MKLFKFLSAKRKLQAVKDTAPQMIYGYTQRGVFLKDTRIGSTTAFVGTEGLTLENNVFIGQFNFVEATNGITIEEGCQITNYCSILTHSSHVAIRLHGPNYRTTKDPIAYNKGSVHIGKYSFIGPHALIMPTTKIGKGCIVSAYSNVRGEFPDFSIIGGNPAKIIGDTRKMDEPYLIENPELREAYEKWTQE
ncbi:MAG: acetyltransferase-like isoleucine patch superfamily enzyme [Flavobacteriaceae bacterium]|jgi:acetyltransferase-like isoleucine patch superfamily enzyme